MNIQFFGVNDLYTAFEAGVKKGRKAVPPKPQARPPAAPGWFDQLSNFMNRSVSVIRTNQWATVAAFTAVNLALLALADKVNDLFKEQIATFGQYKGYVSEGLRAGIIFAGNYAFNALVKYPLQQRAIVAVTIAAIAAKHLFDYACREFCNKQPQPLVPVKQPVPIPVQNENKEAVPPLQVKSTNDEIQSSPQPTRPATPTSSPLNKTDERLAKLKGLEKLTKTN